MWQEFRKLFPGFRGLFNDALYRKASPYKAQPLPFSFYHFGSGGTREGDWGVCAKHLCVTNVTELLLACFVAIFRKH